MDTATCSRSLHFTNASKSDFYRFLRSVWLLFRLYSAFGAVELHKKKCQDIQVEIPVFFRQQIVNRTLKSNFPATAPAAADQT